MKTLLPERWSVLSREVVQMPFLGKLGDCRVSLPAVTAPEDLGPSSGEPDLLWLISEGHTR